MARAPLLVCVLLAAAPPAAAQDTGQCKDAVAKRMQDSEAAGLSQVTKMSYMQALEKAQKAASNNDAQSCLKYVSEARSAASNPQSLIPGLSGKSTPR
jgi:hypothetical protein